MTIIEELERNGITTLKYVNKKSQELKSQFLEMAQLKSNFDIEKFTVRKEGEFIAHNFHFLMRQYSLAMYELRRMLLDKEGHLRVINELEILQKEGVKKTLIYTIEGKQEKYVDIYIAQLLNAIEMLELSIVNKAMMCKGFEACRLKLIELNGNKPITNEQYQAEEPEYWKWFLINKAKQQISQRQSGITEGIWENVRFLEEKHVINPEFQVKMLDNNGNLNLNYIEKKRLLE